MIGDPTSATTHGSAVWRHSALVLGLLALLFAIAVPAVASGQSTPANQQYDGGVPGADGDSDRPGGENGRGEDGAAGKGEKGKNESGAETGEEGNLTSLESDDGGLSTLAIILIVLAVIAAGALAYVWWRGREVGGGPEPPSGGAEPPTGGPEPPA